MAKIQFIEFSPEQLKELIAEVLQAKLKSLSNDNGPLSDSSSNPLLTKVQTAELFDVTVGTITNWANKGLLERHKKGNRVFFLRTDCLNFLEKSNSSTL